MSEPVIGRGEDMSDNESADVRVEFRGGGIEETDEQIEVVDVEEMAEEEAP
jgi:hypothetical protein